jgi:hypothetical protein
MTIGSGVLTATAIEMQRSVLSYRRFGALFCPEEEDDMLLIDVDKHLPNYLAIHLEGQLSSSVRGSD